jgi:hypothetical protein
MHRITHIKMQSVIASWRNVKLDMKAQHKYTLNILSHYNVQKALLMQMMSEMVIMSVILCMGL